MSDEFVPYLKGPQDNRQHRVYNAPDPVEPDELTNKRYVDGRTSGGGGSSVTLGVPSLTLSTTNAIGTSTSAVASNATVAVFDVTAPVTQLFGDAAATGSAAVAARRDHVHGMPANPVVFATPSIQLSTAAAAGSSTSLVRSDCTIVAFDATAPTTQAFGDAAATGSAAIAARRDHKHAMPANPVAYATPSFTLSTAFSAGSSVSLVRSDATLLAFDTTAPVTQAFGDAAAVGTALVAARRDHTHGMPANPVAYAVPAFTLSTGNSIGTSASLIRSDATLLVFDVTAPSTQAFGDAAAVGTATTAARRDHKHAMMADPFAGTTAALAIGGIFWTTVIKSTDTSIASSTTVTADPQLSFTASSSGVYEFEVFVLYQSAAGGGTPDIKIAVGEDAAARGIYAPMLIGSSDAANSLSGQLEGTAVTVAGGTAATNRAVMAYGAHYGNGGTWSFYWSQNTSGTNPTVVKANSILRYRRIV